MVLFDVEMRSTADSVEIEMALVCEGMTVVE